MEIGTPPIASHPPSEISWEMETGAGEFPSDDFTVRRLQTVIREHIKASKLDGKTFCAREGYSPRDLSLFFRQIENRRAGKRMAPDEFIRKLAARFLPAEEPANGGA